MAVGNISQCEGSFLRPRGMTVRSKKNTSERSQRCNVIKHECILTFLRNYFFNIQSKTVLSAQVIGCKTNSGTTRTMT